MGKRLKQTFLQRQTDDQQSHEKTINIPNDSREMQIKTTMRYHLTPVRWPSSKSLQTINAGEGMEKRECSCTVGGNKIHTATMEDGMEVP